MIGSSLCLFKFIKIGTESDIGPHDSSWFAWTSVDAQVSGRLVEDSAARDCVFIARHFHGKLRARELC